ncbi:uncharacterized protein LOC141690966 [Apium graveolens]|uniref:uncharacterized protein LOC141690966 n=1 Tax=Apium graveolens TaxID=4045 RepID=UPI003D793295
MEDFKDDDGRGHKIDDDQGDNNRAADIPRIFPNPITHKLIVDPTRKAVQQKKRTYAPNRLEAIKQEVEKLLEAGFIEEVQFPEWIDTLIDATAEHEMLSFMDGFSGYNQIKRHRDDTRKVSFMTGFGVFCYLVMAFGIKNTGATYQRLVNKIFAHLRKNHGGISILVVEWTISDQEVVGQEIVTPEEGEKDKEEDLTLKENWVFHFDGASKTKSRGVGLVLQSLEWFMIEYTLKLDFPTTNNEAQYEALIVGLGLSRVVRAKSLKICGDPRLVVAQVNGEFETKDDSMAKYLRAVKEIVTQFDEWYAEHVLREKNIICDALSKFASSEIENYLRSIYFQVLRTPTIHGINLIAPIGLTSCGIDPIKNHLETGWLPDDAQEAHKFSVRALRHSLIEGLLYKRSFMIPYLKCLRPHEA